jgi:hypothetical protein
MDENGRKSLLALAIEREDWETAALCLLLGVAEAARKMPHETLDALIEEFDFEIEPRRHQSRRGRKRRGHRGPA